MSERGTKGQTWSSLILVQVSNLREGATRELPGPALNYNTVSCYMSKSRGGHPRSAGSCLKVKSDLHNAVRSPSVPGRGEGE